MHHDSSSPQPSALGPRITLGILAGGRATRLGGLDKAWLSCDGVPQVLRIADRFRSEVAQILVSANRHLERYAEHALTAVIDRVADIGPLAGLDALAQACRTEWLFTLPVDVLKVDAQLPLRLRSLGALGAYARDDDGPQPLVALWFMPALRDGIATALANHDYAIHALQAKLNMACLHCSGVRFGNLNTPADLAVAGVEPAHF